MKLIYFSWFKPSTFCLRFFSVQTFEGVGKHALTFAAPLFINTFKAQNNKINIVSSICSRGTLCPKDVHANTALLQPTYHLATWFLHSSGNGYKAFSPLLINQVNINKALHPEHTSIRSIYHSPMSNQSRISLYNGSNSRAV